MTQATCYDLEEANKVWAHLRIEPKDRTPGACILAGYLDQKPGPFCMSAEELEALTTGKNLEACNEELGDGWYLCQILPRVEWWRGVAVGLAWGKQEHSGIAPEFQPQRDRTIVLLREMLEAYSVAMAAISSFDDEGGRGTAHADLLRRYRIFTRHVCQFAQDVYPEVDLRELWETV